MNCGIHLIQDGIGGIKQGRSFTGGACAKPGRFGEAFRRGGAVFRGRDAVTATRNDSRQSLAAPRAAAIAGVVFSVLLILGLSMLRLAAPDDPSQPGTWLIDPDRRKRGAFCGSTCSRLRGSPFSGSWACSPAPPRGQGRPVPGDGVSWQRVAVRGRALFSAAALAAGLLETIADGHVLLPNSETYYFGRRTVTRFSTSLPSRWRPCSYVLDGHDRAANGLPSAVEWRLVGYAFALVLLLVITNWVWIGLLFPLWGPLLVSRGGPDDGIPQAT